MPIASNIIGISAGSGDAAEQADFTIIENLLTAQLIEMRLLNYQTWNVGIGYPLTGNDPNEYRLDAAAQGLYANPPVTPSPGQA